MGEVFAVSNPAPQTQPRLSENTLSISRLPKYYIAQMNNSCEIID